MRSTFVKCLIDQARKDDRIFLVSADMGFSAFETFREELPGRFLNAGVAEQNAVSVAAGLAMSGFVVYVYSIIPFITMRCFEQIRIDVAYMNNNVRLVGVGAGLTYGASGPTHHALEDIAIMRSLPNMTVCCPGDPHETSELIKQSFDYEGPVYFRLGKNGEPRIHKDGAPIVLGKAALVNDGDDLAIITTSNMLESSFRCVQELEEKGVHAALVSMHTIKPLDTEIIIAFIERGIPIITVEEHTIIGGLGSAAAEIIAESGKAVKFKRIAIPDCYMHLCGGHQLLREKSGLCLNSEELLAFCRKDR